MKLSWPTVSPIAALVLCVLALLVRPHPLLLTVCSVALVAAVLSAVHHAEVVAHRVGEPFGSLILAVAVTVIEVGLIITLMSHDAAGVSGLARDTVFSAVMITTNGIVGLALLAGAIRHDLVYFRSDGTAAALTTVIVLATLSMVVPVYTSAPGGTFTEPQLAFAAISALLLYTMFVVTQTKRHRDFFQPVDHNGETVESAPERAARPSIRSAWVSLGLLLVALCAVIGLAKSLSPAIEAGVRQAGLPHSFVGVLLALLVLAPEGLAAVRAARAGKLQTSFNLSYGSAMASIGLTIPVIAVVSWIVPGLSLDLGLTPLHQVLLIVTAIVSILTVVPGKATRLQGGIHLVLFVAFVFLSAFP